MNKEKVLDVGTVESYQDAQMNSFKFVWFLISQFKIKSWK
jgi:hypothetical protein